jgi:predicted DNA-binding WGR domain protein
MSVASQKKFLQAQISETGYLLSLVKDDPLMSFSLEQKNQELQEELLCLPETANESKVVLLFSGKAVVGSKGIKAKFITDAIRPFQELIKTQTAIVRYGKVGKRGKSKNSKHSDLYLTALPRGSFGIELSQLETSDIFSEEEVSEAIVQVMDLIESSVKSDEAFEEILSNTPVRNLNNLKTFFKVIDKEKSILKMESGSKEIDISEESIHRAYERVNAATKEDEEIFENGTLRGVMLETVKFEFVNDDGYKYSGLINPEVPEETVSEFLNKSCQVHIKKTRTKFISGNEKITYELLEIKENLNL